MLFDGFRNFRQVFLREFLPRRGARFGGIEDFLLVEKLPELFKKFRHVARSPKLRLFAFRLPIGDAPDAVGILRRRVFLLLVAGFHSALKPVLNRLHFRDFLDALFHPVQLRLEVFDAESFKAFLDFLGSVRPLARIAFVELLGDRPAQIVVRPKRPGAVGEQLVLRGDELFGGRIEAGKLQDFEGRRAEHFRWKRSRERARVERSRDGRHVGIFDFDVVEEKLPRGLPARRGKSDGGDFLAQPPELQGVGGDALRVLGVFRIRRIHENRFENLEPAPAGRRADGQPVEQQGGEHGGNGERADARCDFQLLVFFERLFVNFDGGGGLHRREFVHGNGVRQIVEQQLFAHVRIELFRGRLLHGFFLRAGFSGDAHGGLLFGGNEIRQRLPLGGTRLRAGRFRRELARGGARGEIFGRERADGLSVDEKHKFFHERKMIGDLCGKAEETAAWRNRVYSAEAFPRNQV